MRRVQAQMAATRRSIAFAFVLSLTLAGALGIAVYNLDKAYIASKFDLLAYVPDRIPAGTESSLLVMALDRDGAPIPNQPIQLKLKTNESTMTVWSGYTDEEGSASPQFTAPAESGKAEIIVSSGAEELVTPTVIDDTIRIIITADKPIYQPGQTMHLRVLTFAGDDPLPESAPLILEVIDPNGDKIFKKQLTPNEYGISSYDLALSDQIIQGTYTVKAYSGEREATRAVIVKEYVLPKFRVDILGMKDWYSVNENVRGTVDAEYFFGMEVQGTVEVNVSVYYGVWTQIYSTDGLLSLGQFSFSTPMIGYAVGIPSAQGNGYMQVNVSVTDTGGHTETRSKLIPIAPSSISLSVLTDSCVLGQPSVFYAIARSPDGRAVANRTITMYLNDENGYTSNHLSNVTDDRGVAKFEFIYSGETTALISAFSSQAGALSVDLGDGTGIKVFPDKASYAVGEVGMFSVFYSGNSLTTNVYYDVVSRGFVVDRGVVRLSGGSADIQVQMVPEMEPFAQVRMYKIEGNMDVVRDAVTFNVGSGEDFNVSVSSDNSSYYPRDNVTLQFQTALSGQGIPAALGVSIVDEAVYELDSMFQGYEQLIFGLDQEFAVPQYQILSYVYADAPALPSETEAVLSELDAGRLGGTGERTMAEAKALMEKAVESYWYSMYLLCGIGVVGLAAFGMRRSRRLGRKAKGGLGFGLAVAAVVVVGLLVLAGLYTMTLGFGSGSQSPIGGGEDDNRRQFAPTGVGGVDFGDLFEGQGSAGGDEALSGPTPTVVRNYFPETWYWNPCLVTNESGETNVTLQAPDSITSWKTDVIASTLDGRIATESASIVVFQPFFIDPDIPVSVVRGDEFPLKVQVYNYLSRTQSVNVTITPEPWFTLLAGSTQSVAVDANYVSYVTFMIKASRAGWHTLTISAIAGEVQDAIVKPIHVVPDGMKVETLYNGEVENSAAERSLRLDPARVENGETSWVKLQGGVEAVLLEGVEAFIQFVTGCGEQSLSTLSIDILAYDTVRQLGTAPEKLFEYESMVNQGLQHELTFLVKPVNGEGRGIVWFPGDQDAHPWLTSWGLIAFQDAVNAGFGLDQKIIADMQKWLMSIQESDGSWVFPDWGIYEFNNPILKAKKISSTAYIARALQYSGVPASEEHIAKAIDYIEANAGSIKTDPYTTALVLLVLQQGSGSTALRAELAVALDSMKKTDNETYYWTSSTNMISDNGGLENPMDMWGGYSSTHVIETTGYAATALDQEMDYKEVVDGAVKYLLNHRQSLGGWYSTQDTIVAFQTLNSVTGDTDIEEIVAEVKVNDVSIFAVEMNDFNKDVTYYVDLRPYLTNVTNVSVSSQGTGTLLYSIYLAQYVPWPLQPASSPYLTLRVTYDTTHIPVTDRLTAHMYLLYDGLAPAIKMILVDLRAPMGFSFVLSEFDALQSDGVIASYDSNDRQVLVYITDVVKGTPVQFDYSLVAEMPIKSTVQDISAWDMYDPNNLRAETSPVQFEAA